MLPLALRFTAIPKLICEDIGVQQSSSSSLPPVSYVMPVLNEADYLASAVNAVLAQRYPAATELILALAYSTDGTAEIAESLAAADPRVRIVANPARDISAGLNTAIASAIHPVIVRVDAHSELSDNYTETAVRSLLSSGAANVGGIMQAHGKTPVQRVIAACYNSPVGLGGGAYHGADKAHPADSAYLGVFWRDAWQMVGGFDETVRRGEDWEFNLRLRLAGKTVWFNPELRVFYSPRSSFAALAKQFFATGVWRAMLVKRHPKLHPLRYFVPGLLVLFLALTALVTVLTAIPALAPVLVWVSAPALFLCLLYFAALTLTACRLPGLSLRERLLAPFSFLTMHTAWGLGFLRGFCFGTGDTVDRSRLSV